MPRDGERSPTKLLAPIRDTDYRVLAQALVLGTIGGAVFNALNLPLPWMLGAMLFTSSVRSPVPESPCRWVCATPWW